MSRLYSRGVQSFRAAIEADDLDAAQAMLADDVVFRSPVAHSPYPGKAITGAILRAVSEVFTDFRYVREFHDADGPDHVLVFEAQVDGLDVTGADFLTLDADGRIVELMVMVRPLQAAQALAARMSERYPQIRAAALSSGG